MYLPDIPMEGVLPGFKSSFHCHLPDHGVALFRPLIHKVPIHRRFRIQILTIIHGDMSTPSRYTPRNTLLIKHGGEFADECLRFARY